MATLVSLITGMRDALTLPAGNLFTTSTCFFAFDPKQSLLFPPSDQFVVIQPSGLKVPDRVFRGQGKIGFLVTLDFTLNLYVRLALDEYNRSDIYLTEPTLGSLDLADQIIAVFQNYVLMDTDGVNGWGYGLESVTWQTEEKDSVGWGVTKFAYRASVTGRSVN